MELVCKDSKPNTVIISANSAPFAESTDKIPSGDHQVRMEFAYAGGGLAKAEKWHYILMVSKPEQVMLVLTAAMVSQQMTDAMLERIQEHLYLDYSPHGNDSTVKLKTFKLQ